MSDNINSTLAYVILHEEHLWNVSVVQRVYLSNLVYSFLVEVYIAVFGDPQSFVPSSKGRLKQSNTY
jgi:hypothetical protein